MWSAHPAACTLFAPTWTNNKRKASKIAPTPRLASTAWGALNKASPFSCDERSYSINMRLHALQPFSSATCTASWLKRRVRRETSKLIKPTWPREGNSIQFALHKAVRSAYRSAAWHTPASFRPTPYIPRGQFVRSILP